MEGGRGTPSEPDKGIRDTAGKVTILNTVVRVHSLEKLTTADYEAVITDPTLVLVFIYCLS